MILELKKSHLIKEGKAKKIKKFGITLFNAKEREFEDAPYLNKMKIILKQLPECDNFFYPKVKIYLTYIKQYLEKLKEKASFIKLINELETEIYWEWKKSKPEHTQKNLNFEDFSFAQKVNDYIQKRGEIE